MSVFPIVGPSTAIDCSPEVRKATATEFELVNPTKQSNFLIGELVNAGQLSFVIENLPKTSPRSGCPGQWMFQQMMTHFGTSVTAIQGNWIGATSDNLLSINQFAMAGSMSIEVAAARTWTGLRANDYGFTRVQIVGATGTPGHYTRVNVLFEK